MRNSQSRPPPSQIAAFAMFTLSRKRRAALSGSGNQKPLLVVHNFSWHDHSVKAAYAFIFGAALVASSHAGAAGQDEPLCADRPGLATPTCTVPTGLVQAEISGVNWSRNRSSEVIAEELTIGETAFKIGVTDYLHIEVAAAPYVRSKVQEIGASDRASAFGDLTLAAKYRFPGLDGPLQLALRPSLKIPTARSPLGNGKVEAGLIIPIDYALPRSTVTLGLSPELNIVADDDGTGNHLAMTQVVAISAPLSDHISAAAEISAEWDWAAERTGREYFLGGSIAYLMSEDFQLDVGIVLGLNRPAADVELYSGMALRF
ncbi:MAG: transporter [Aureliella sp.]